MPLKPAWLEAPFQHLPTFSELPEGVRHNAKCFNFLPGDRMFIRHQQRPDIEFDTKAG